MKKKPTRTVGFSPWGHKWGDLGPFVDLFTHKQDITDTGFKGMDCLLLWGGEDIHPSFYGEPPHPKNENQDLEPSERDIFEWKAMLYCKANNIPIIGVCRGAQFACAFAGGKVAQHVNGHSMEHPIRTVDGRTMVSTSVHHQMMQPYDVAHTLLAWAYPAKSQFYMDGKQQDILTLVEEHEPEVVFFPEIRALAIQGHPEYAYATHAFKEYCVEMARKYLFNEEAK